MSYSGVPLMNQTGSAKRPLHMQRNIVGLFSIPNARLARHSPMQSRQAQSSGCRKLLWHEHATQVCRHPSLLSHEASMYSGRHGAAAALHQPQVSLQNNPTFRQHTAYDWRGEQAHHASKRRTGDMKAGLKQVVHSVCPWRAHRTGQER